MTQCMIVLLCGHVYRAPVRFLRLVGGDVSPDYLAARVDRTGAARHASVTEDVIKTWTYRGWVDPETGVRHRLSTDGGYLIAEVLKAERDTRRSGRSHRRLPPPSAYRAA